MAQLLTAALVEQRIGPALTRECAKLKRTPRLAVFLVGDDPAGALYTGKKKKFIEAIGGECHILKMAKDICPEDFLARLQEAFADPAIHGCLVQLPLPAHLAHLRITALIPQEKDVDGLGVQNMAALLGNADERSFFTPCTPKGIVTLLAAYGISLAGKRVAILGRSQIVGKPMALLSLNRQGTPTICHSQTPHIKSICRESDVIISAMGVPRLLDASYIGDNKPVVVDVGINRDGQGKLCGDVDFSRVAPLCSAITPVPGGVGPMTVLSLAQNLLQAARQGEKR